MKYSHFSANSPQQTRTGYHLEWQSKSDPYPFRRCMKRTENWLANTNKICLQCPKYKHSMFAYSGHIPPRTIHRRPIFKQNHISSFAVDRTAPSGKASDTVKCISSRARFETHCTPAPPLTVAINRNTSLKSIYCNCHPSNWQTGQPARPKLVRPFA